MFEFEYNMEQMTCKQCHRGISLQAYQRKSSYCDDCEVARLLTPTWFEVFLEKLSRWDNYRHHLPSFDDFD